MVTMQIESLCEKLQSDIKPILLDNYDELTANKHVVKLNPDWDRYYDLQNHGKLKVFTMRDSDEKLVGYAAFFIDTHIHYKDLLVATNDVIFTSQIQRSGMQGIRFINFIHKNLIDSVDKIVWHIKDHLDFSPLLVRHGYKKEDSLWALTK
jgi:hypothetical protein